jgi:hypothetical protein
VFDGDIIAHIHAAGSTLPAGKNHKDSSGMMYHVRCDW